MKFQQENCVLQGTGWRVSILPHYQDYSRASAGPTSLFFMQDAKI